jgi:hypothetical protein
VYQLQIQDANQGGLQHYVYRLSIVRGAIADGVEPLGEPVERRFRWS